MKMSQVRIGLNESTLDSWTAYALFLAKQVISSESQAYSSSKRVGAPFGLDDIPEDLPANQGQDQDEDRVGSGTVDDPELTADKAPDQDQDQDQDQGNAVDGGGTGLDIQVIEHQCSL